MIAFRRIALVCLCVFFGIPVSSSADDRSGLRGLSRVDQEQPVTIEGMLTYPGESLPDDLEVCAVDIATARQTCTSKRIRLKRKGRPEGYRLQLPAGSYQVYSHTRESGKETRAYFTDFVICGYQGPSCPSHNVMAVTLAPGSKRSDVEPGDWYTEQPGGAVAPDTAPTAAEVAPPQPQQQAVQTPQPKLQEGKRSYRLIGRADRSCEEAKGVLSILRKSLTVKPASGPDAQAGEMTSLTWSLGGQPSQAPAYLILAVDHPVRVEGKGFYTLLPDAIAPFRLQQFKDRTRIILPLHLQSTPRQGSLDIRPLRAGTLTVSAGIVGVARCGELADPAPRTFDLTVRAGTPEIVIADKFETNRPDQSIASPDGTRRIDIFGPRWRLIDTRSGAQLSDRVGSEPRFSPTGRFAIALAEDRFTLFDAVDGMQIRQLWSGSQDLAWDDRDSFLVIGAGGNGLINVDYPSNETDPQLQVGDGCRICSAVQASAVKIDLENNLVLGKGTPAFDTVADAYARLLTGSATFRDVRNKPRNGSIESVDGQPVVYSSSISAFAAPYQMVPLDIPDKWDFIDGLKFTVQARAYSGDSRETERFRAAIGRFLVPPLLVATAGDRSPGPVDAIVAATRGIGRIPLSPASIASKQERRLAEFGLELNAGQSLSAIQADTLLRRGSNQGVLIFRDDRKIHVQDLLADGGECGSAVRGADGSVTIMAYEPRLEELRTPTFTLTFFGGNCNSGSAGFLTPQRFVVDSRHPGEVFDLLEGIGENPFSTSDRCPIALGACGISGTFFFDRYLVVWSKESFAAIVYDLETHKVLHSLINLPSPEVMQRMSLSRDLKTLTKIDDDGGFQVIDLTRSQKTPDGRYTPQSVLAPVVLSGRVVDDEVVVMTPSGQFDATLEGASFVSMKLPGRSGEYTLQQYRDVLHKPGLLRRVLAGERFPALAIDRFPPVIALKTSPAAGRVRAQVDILEEKAGSLRIYQDGQFTDEITVDDGASSVSVDVARLPGARWIAIVAKGTSGLYSQALTFDAGPLPGSKRRIHLISVGIDRYDDPKINQLELAASDAKRFHRAIEGRAGPSEEIVSDALLTDAGASKDAILGSLKQAIGKAEAGDTILLFVAGHGIQTPDGSYFLATTQTRLGDIENTALRWTELAALLAGSKLRVAVFLDSCHSGSAGTGFFATSDTTTNALIDSMPSGIVIFSAAKGRELSEESPSRGGGVFTDAMVRAIADKDTDLNGDGMLEASELYAGVKGAVMKATDGRQTPWFARNDMVGDFVPF
ncbi:hypothetical protein LMIY3S_04935 [Labrys miyagiensis]